MPHIHDLIDFTVEAYIVKDGKILFIRHKILKRWLPIGGHIELDEDPEEALFREVKEECGLDIRILGTVPSVQCEGTKVLHVPAFLDIHRFSETHRHVGMGYIATSESSDVKLNEEEHTDIRWLSNEDLDDPRYDLLPTIAYYAREALKRAAT
jgi:8-oxo-dGTP pyrophosphatase MutT (NUDIX family)